MEDFFISPGHKCRSEDTAVEYRPQIVPGRKKIGIGRLAAVLIALCCAMVAVPHARANEDVTHFSIPPGTADVTLVMLAEQSNTRILFPFDEAKAVETNEVSGDLTVDEALSVALAGTKLRGSLESNGVIVVSFVSNPTQEQGNRDMNNRKFKNALMSALALPFALPPVSAQAQDDGARDEDRIIVTGTRIKRAGYNTLQPATTVDSEFIDARAYSNVADALNESPVFGLPGAVPDQTRQNAPTIGQNFVNLFGLGSQRTLTLLNGRRVVGGNAAAVGGDAGSGLQVDLNIIPTVLVDRIETVFIGGSPIYGSDAVAGTVNIILKDDFEGYDIDSQYGITERGDGQEFRVRGAFGGNFADDRGNLVVAAEYNWIDRLDQIERAQAFAWSNCPTRASVFGFDGTTPGDGQPDNALCRDGGNVWQVPSTGAPMPLDTFLGHPGAVNPDGAPNQDTDGDGIPDSSSFLPGGSRAGTFINANGVSNPGNFFLDANGNPFIFSLDGAGIVTFDEANLGDPLSAFFSHGAGNKDNIFVVDTGEAAQLKPETERWNFFAKGHYDLTDDIRIVSEFLYARLEVIDARNQPEWNSFAFGRNSNLAIKLDNPYLPDVAEGLIAGQLPDGDSNGMADANLDTDGDGAPDTVGFFLTRSNFDLMGDLQKHREQDTFRVLFGLEGVTEAMNREWTWDASFYFGQNNAVSRQPVLNSIRLSYAIDAVVDPDTNEIACRVSVDPPVDPRQGNIGTFPPLSDITDCVPFNPFGYNNFSQEAADYVLQEQFQSAKNQQAVVEVNAAGELFDLPGGPVDIALGAAHRREKAEFNVSQGNEIDIPGRRAAPPQSSRGQFNSTEIYGETVLPIFDNDFTPLPVIERLWIEGAGRFVDNNVAGQDITWTAGGRANLNLPLFGPDGFQVRGNFTQSIRSPSILELFLPRSGSFDNSNDPCDPRFIGSGPRPSVRRANCEALVASLMGSGDLDPNFVLADFVSRAANARTPSVVGGNIDLKSEVADSWTVGAVLAPEALPGFRPRWTGCRSPSTTPLRRSTARSLRMRVLTRRISPTTKHAASSCVISTSRSPSWSRPSGMRPSARSLVSSPM